MVTVGIIGTGMIGQDHLRRLARRLSGVRVIAVTDVDLSRARTAADDMRGVTVHVSGPALIADSRVDAVVVTSSSTTHEEYVLAAIAAGKPVFCEKPLAPTRGACDRIVDAEVAAGRRLVSVGFMRRYDPRYRAMKAALAAGEIGAPLLMHAAHRNVSVPDTFTSEMIVTETVVHDVDVARWMFDEEVVAVTVLTPRVSGRARTGLRDPLFVLLETASGVLVDVEASMNTGCYDIRGEVVGEDGSVELSQSAGAMVTRAGAVRGPVPTDWRERFAAAYDAELQAWVDAVAAGEGTSGPSTWDGYAATGCCEAGLAALRSRAREPVVLRHMPDLYMADG